MFQITILAVGRLKERYLAEGTAEYLKRLSAYARVRVVEVAEESFDAAITPAGQELVRRKEGERLLDRLRPGSYLIVLDRSGRMLASEEMAESIRQLGLAGRSDITLAIGGTLGLPPQVLERAGLRLSMGRITLPHQLIRLVLLEQLYRCFKIIRGEPYHR